MERVVEDSTAHWLLPPAFIFTRTARGCCNGRSYGASAYKGAKDRMVKLSAQLLGVMRDYWRVRRPVTWLFPQAKNPDRPMDSSDAWRMVHRTAKRAGITR